MSGKRGGGAATWGPILAVAAAAMMTTGDAASQAPPDRRPSFVQAQPAAPPPAPPLAPAPRVRLIARVPPLTDPVNTGFLKALAAKRASRCGQQEMAPGVWVRIDCQTYNPIAKAVPHYNLRKQKLLKTGRLRAFAKLPSFIGGAVAPSAPPSEGASRAPQADGPGRTTATSDGDIPETMDLRALGAVGPVKNQGAVGSCTAFSLSSVLDSMLLRSGKAETVSPLHLWSHYGSPHMDKAFDNNLNRPITTYASWPYTGREACQLSRETDDDCGSVYGVKPNSADADARLRGSIARADGSGVLRFVQVERLDRNVDLDEVVQVIASGQPLWVAFKLNSDSWRTRNMVNFVIQDWTSWDGGHAVALVGYRKTRWGRQFLVQNSWGDQWGDAGFAWVNEAMVKRFMYHAYKVRLEPAQAPVNALTDEDCPWDKIVDRGLNACADFCMDEENPRPNNGKCGGAGDGSKKK